MANKRVLKKRIHQVAGVLFTECIIFREFIPNVDAEAVGVIMDDVLAFQDDFLSRVNHYGGKNNPAEVRKYFGKLIEDIQKESLALFDKLKELNK